MNALRAHLENVWREALDRWVLVAYFVLTTLFILVSALAFNLDIVNGAFASARFFGRTLSIKGGNPVTELVTGLQTGLVGVFFIFAVFLAIFATAHLVPTLQEKGTVDLYLSRPLSRTRVLLYRYLAGLLLGLLDMAYLFGSFWLLIGLKSGVWRPQFLVAGGVIFFYFACLLAFSFLVGVITGSTGVSLMAVAAAYFCGALMAAHESIAAEVSSNAVARVIETIYWVLPKTTELIRVTLYCSAGDEHAAALLPSHPGLAFLSTGLFGAAALALATLLFNRKDF